MFDDRFIDSLSSALAPKVAALLAHKPDDERLPPRWLNFKQAAALMSSTEDAVRGMARAKRFPVKRMGARLWIDVRDLEKAFAENTEYLH